MPVMQRTNFSDSMAEGFRAIFLSEYDQVPTQYPQLFNMLTSRKQYEDDSYVAGFGTIPKKTEGSTITADAAIQGFDERYTHDTYALQYEITEEMIEDELYGLISQFPAELAVSMRITREQSGANIYNNGFDSSVQTGGDGKELFATDHPLVGGGTQKNELTSAADLEIDSLEQALIDIRATTDDRGKLINLRPRTLIVPPELERKALEIMGSSLDPESANNTINVYKGRLNVVVNDFLTDTDAWFILCDRHKVIWFDRIMPDHETGNDFNTGNMKHKVRSRWSNGWSLPWGAFGTPGV